MKAWLIDVAYGTPRGDAAAVMRKAPGPSPRKRPGIEGVAKRMLVNAPWSGGLALERAQGSSDRLVKAYRSSFSVFASVHPRGS